MRMSDRPSGGSFSSKMKGFLRPGLFLSFGMPGLGCAVLFGVARADWMNLNCSAWPLVGNCADAVFVQWLTGVLALVLGGAFFCQIRERR